MAPQHAHTSRFVVVLLSVMLLFLGPLSAESASVHALPTCATVFACHRDGHNCLGGVKDGSRSASASRAPPLVSSPGEDAFDQACTLPIVNGAAAAAARQGPRRQTARVEDGVYILLGHPAAPFHAPLQSPCVLFFQNMSDTYLKWHPESNQGVALRGLEDAGNGQTAGTATSTQTLHNGVEEEEDMDEVYEGSAVRHDGQQDASLHARFGVVLVRRVMTSARLRALQYWEQLRHYPWHTPAAFETIFFRRVWRVRYLVASIQEDAEEEDEQGMYDNKEGVSSSSSSSSSAQASRRKPRGGVEKDVSSRYGEFSTSSLFSRGSFRGLRVVSFPPTPLFVPTGPSSSTTKAAVSMSSANVMYTCDFRAVRAAKQHVDEGSAYQQHGDGGRDRFNDLSRGDVYGMEEDIELDLTDIFGGGGGRRRAGASSAAVDKKRFSVIAYLLSRWLPATLTGASSASRRPTLSPSQRAAEAYLARVQEELGPFQPSRALLPSTVQQILGTRVLATRQNLRITTTTSTAAVAGQLQGSADARTRRGEHRLLYDFIFDVELPATRSMCLAVSVSPAADAARLVEVARARVGDSHSTSADGVPVHVSEFLVFDWLWVKLLLLYAFLVWMRPRVQDSRVLRFITAGLCGTVILFIFFLFYLFRRLQSMSVGKVGLAVAVTMGGVAAFAEGLVSVLQYTLYALQDQLTSEVWLYLGFVMICVSVLSSFLVQWLFSEAVLQSSTRLGLHSVSALCLTLTYRHNSEATALALIAFVLFRPRLVYCVLLWCSGAGKFDVSESDPAEKLPAAAQRPVRFSAPLAAEGQRYIAMGTRKRNRRSPVPGVDDGADEADTGAGDTAGMHSSHALNYQQKMAQFEQDGAHHTRIALEQLAAHLRANPTRYVDRVRDPNRVYRWAGCVDPGSENVNDDDDDLFGDEENDDTEENE